MNWGIWKWREGPIAKGSRGRAQGGGYWDSDISVVILSGVRKMMGWAPVDGGDTVEKACCVWGRGWGRLGKRRGGEGRRKREERRESEAKMKRNV